MPSTMTPFQRAMALAAITGLKLSLGPAFLMTSRKRQGARGVALAAMGELVLDKAGFLPSRYNPALLIPRTLAGAWVAHESLKEDGVEDPLAAPMGAVIAAGFASVAPMARIALSRGLGIPDLVLGVAEDYLALRLGSEATGMSMEEIAGVAKESFEEAKEQVKPALASIGVEA
ncbi:hypothetical protein [Singulisphaera sp. PoT]|uniref:hypothetical protein n=1 Tax=Singulisphaera sp. PoT TaxID=3411797 RepID=UPI003BF4FC57